MADSSATQLFPEDARNAARTGILPFQAINAMLREHEIWSKTEILADQVQPASIDLRLGPIAYRVRASFLPGPDYTVLDKMQQLDAYPVDIGHGAVLEKGCVYVVPLLEALNLKSGVTAFANPKSSTGRLDILTRLIGDYSHSFDRLDKGYQGPLYVEIAPRTFSVVVRTGTRLNQLRFRRGSPVIAASELQRLHDEGQLILSNATDQNFIERKMLRLSVDLHGGGKGRLIGYRAKKHTDRIDVEKIAAYDPLDFWEPIHYHRDPPLILDPDAFYILVTKEAVRIPPDFAAEMVAYDTSVGEFRVHYAGFFDPGFGWGDAVSRAVLEVRSHEVPFTLEDGQTVGWLQYERMAGRPDRLYGAGIKSNYQGQSLQLAKQFKPFGG
ncbi:MAG TPA: 2'-deoxycytidine 5'-triphosphate deaminase [Stellaceae bacterium]|nr:2'-deoxycytidine 5'-triphosphate deaminase [Stellaceae bacterium]